MITKSSNSIYVSLWLWRLLFVIVTIHWALTIVIPRHVTKASRQFFQSLNCLCWSCFIELRGFFNWAELKIQTDFLSQAHFMKKMIRNKRITTTVFLVLLWNRAYQNGLRSFFRISRITCNLWIVLISKRFNPLKRDWSQMKDFLK